MSQTKLKRDPALDLIRIFALFCVIAAHFFLNGGYYEVFIIGTRLYIATVMRTFLMICVPLFLMLSGYLMRHKKATKAYYTKLIRILGEYILASLFCMAYTAVNQGGSASDMLKTFLLQSFGILSFEAARYGWYVKMYIGLFLFIPYLNVLYNGLQGKEQKQRLILTMLLLSGIPEVLNSVRFSLPWVMTFNDPSGFLTVFPDWWSGIYPIGYYFMGTYLSEYPLKLKKGKTIAWILVAVLLAGTYSYLHNMGKEFLYEPWQDHQSLFVVIPSVLVFHFFLQLDLSRVGCKGRKMLAVISDLCFCAYLVSFVYDQYFYSLFRGIAGRLVNKLQYFVVLVPIVMICSLATSACLVSFYRMIEKAIKGIAIKNKV